MKALWQASVLILLSAVAALAVHAWHPHAPALHLVEEPLREDELNIAAIKERFGGHVLWIDARPQEQYDAAHIPGAHLLNDQGFDDQILGLLETLQRNDKPVVVYCGGQKCEASRKVMERLRELGLVQHAFILKGGFGTWESPAAP